MTELGSDEIKNALAARLLQIAPGMAVYREAATSPRYPHFFVHLISATDEEDRRLRHFVTYSFDLRYRVASDPSTDLRLESDLDVMALKLMAGLNIIPCNDIKVRCEEKNYEKTDGVLHFFLSVTVQAALVGPEAETAKQNRLGVEVELREKR